MGRTLDYLETRKDIDSAKMAYQGFSYDTSLDSTVIALSTVAHGSDWPASERLRDLERIGREAPF